MQVIIWFLSLLIFSWCYSTLFSCLFTLKTIPVAKISTLVYLGILIALYTIAYFLINIYFNDILICSIIAGILGFITAKKRQ